MGLSGVGVNGSRATFASGSRVAGTAPATRWRRRACATTDTAAHTAQSPRVVLEACLSEPVGDNRLIKQTA
eukprot:1209983-Pyramimonas_sp.AAC.2